MMQHKRKAFIFIQKSSLALAEEKGREARHLEIARNMKVAGMPVTQIVELTGLSREQVKQLG